MSEKKIQEKKTINLGRKHLFQVVDKPQIFTEMENTYERNKQTGLLVKTGEVNIQEEIQAQNVGLSIEELYHKYLRTGDKSYLEKAGGVFDDVSEYPNNINDIFAKVQSMEGIVNDIQNYIQQNQNIHTESNSGNQSTVTENNPNVPQGSPTVEGVKK